MGPSLILGLNQNKNNEDKNNEEKASFGKIAEQEMSFSFLI